MSGKKVSLEISTNCSMRGVAREKRPSEFVGAFALVGLKRYVWRFFDIASVELFHNCIALLTGVIEPINDLVHVSLAARTIIIIVVFTHADTGALDMPVFILFAHFFSWIHEHGPLNNSAKPSIIIFHPATWSRNPALSFQNKIPLRHWMLSRIIQRDGILHGLRMTSNT